MGSKDGLRLENSINSHAERRRAPVCSVGTLKVVVDDGLNAGFGAGGVVTESVEAGLGGVDRDDLFESGFTTGKLGLVESALGFALLE